MNKNLLISILISSLLFGCNKNISNSVDSTQTGLVPTMEEPIPHVEEQKEGHDIRLDILHHYDLDFIGNTFEIDSAEKCLSVLKKYQNIKNTIDCNTNFSGKEFGSLGFGINEKGNNYYQIFLGETDLGGISFLDDYYNPTTNTLFDGKYLSGNNLGFISAPTEISYFTIKSKQASLFKDTLNLYVTMTNKKIGDFSMNINYIIRGGVNPNELIKLLQGDFPYELNLDHENGIGMGDAYKLLQTSSKRLEIFGQSENYFADSWGSDISADIFVTTAPTPTNTYFSEVFIYFLNTQAYNNKENERTILSLIKGLKWRDNFLLD